MGDASVGTPRVMAWRLGLSAVALLVLVMLVSPALVGYRAETLYRAVEAESLKALPDVDEVSERHYRRGWFRSTASLAVVIRPGRQVMGVARSVPAQLQTQIAHGPLVWLTPSGLPAVARSRTDVRLLDRPHAAMASTLDGELRLDGSMWARWRAPEGGSLTTADGMRLDVAPAEALIRRSRDGRTLSAELVVPQLSLMGAAAELVRLDGVVLELAALADASGAVRRTFEIGLDRVRVERPDPVPEPTRTPFGGLTMDAVGVQIDQDVDAGRMNLRLALVTRRIDSGGEVLGPADVAVALEHLQTDALSGLMDGLRTLRVGGVSQETRGLAQAMMLARLVSALTASDVRARLDPLRIGTPDGDAVFRLTLGLDRGVAGSLVGSRVATDWLALVRADGALEIPRSLASPWLTRLLAQSRAPLPAGAGTSDHALGREAEAVLDRWARERWITITDDRIVTSMRLGDGLLTINGKTLPLR